MAFGSRGLWDWRGLRWARWGSPDLQQGLKHSCVLEDGLPWEEVGKAQPLRGGWGVLFVTWPVISIVLRLTSNGSCSGGSSVEGKSPEISVWKWRASDAKGRSIGTCLNWLPNAYPIFPQTKQHHLCGLVCESVRVIHLGEKGIGWRCLEIWGYDTIGGGYVYKKEKEMRTRSLAILWGGWRITWGPGGNPRR